MLYTVQHFENIRLIDLNVFVIYVEKDNAINEITSLSLGHILEMPTQVCLATAFLMA